MYVVCFVFIVRLILSIAAVVCLERIVNEIICYVSSSTKNTADLITQLFFVVFSQMTGE